MSLPRPANSENELLELEVKALSESRSDEAQKLYREFAARKKQSLLALKPHLDNSSAYALQLSRILKLPMSSYPQREVLPVVGHGFANSHRNPSASLTAANTALTYQESSQHYQQQTHHSFSNNTQHVTEPTVTAVELIATDPFINLPVSDRVTTMMTTTKKKSVSHPLKPSTLTKSTGTTSRSRSNSSSRKKRVASGDDMNNEVGIIQLPPPKKKRVTKRSGSSIDNVDQVRSRKRTSRLIVDMELHPEATTTSSSRRSNVKRRA